ncbi:hypothetical protein EUS_01050 [[Eubacterium] siraeum 70/3]|uniref:Uncharacterized protein n=1 Tax=[Eubacterium] siraeum 70/3 TaxID=657319 RepID=D4JQU3_9FIRM|nr:hypothetical protein EUS_01050 [[Eubacterium] siraeum 70/3]
MRQSKTRYTSRSVLWQVGNFFILFFQTFFYPYINNVANGVLIYLKNEHCNVFSSGFQSFFPSLFAWKKAEEKMRSTVYNKAIKL